MDIAHSNIEVDCKTDTFQINHHQIQRMGTLTLCQLGLGEWELAITFVDEEEIRELNQNFREKDRSTDVLSFPQAEWDDPISVDQPFLKKKQNGPRIPQVLGDVVISPANAEANAVDIGQGLDREIAFLITHGILHLCGHDHIQEDEEKIMIREQKLLMARFDDEDPPSWSGCITRVAH